MRLWHQKLIPLLPRQQLLGQHRECCALRGKGWGKKHATVDYIFHHKFKSLVLYHFYVMKEMSDRGYNIDPRWYIPNYRGKIIGTDFSRNVHLSGILKRLFIGGVVYPEHNEQYYQECIENLKMKGITI